MTKTAEKQLMISRRAEEMHGVIEVLSTSKMSDEKVLFVEISHLYFHWRQCKDVDQTVSDNWI